jgi:uncharacterized protein
MNQKINLGIIEPKRFVLGDNIVLFNPYTNKKIFTTLSDENKISKTEIKKLKKTEFEIEKPKIKKYRIEITLKCNCACDYCLVYNNDICQINNSMSLDTAKKITEQFNKEIPNGSFMIIGGEPLVNKEVLDYFLENINGKINVFTNATLINEDWAIKLSKENVKTFVSFDGWKELNFHRNYLSKKPIYEDTLKGYELLKKYNAKTAINCLVTNDNVDYILEIVKYFFENYNETSFGLSIPHYTKENHFTIDIKKYTEEMLKIYDYMKINNIYVDQISKRLDFILNEKFRFSACKMAGEQRTFYPNRNETLCTKIDTLPEYKTKNSDFFKNMVPLNNHDNICKNCDAISMCGGGCFWDALFDESKKDTRDCYFNKELLKKILFDMSQYAKKNVVIDKKMMIKNYSNLFNK